MAIVRITWLTSSLYPSVRCSSRVAIACCMCSGYFYTSGPPPRRATVPRSRKLPLSALAIRRRFFHSLKSISR